MALRFKFKARPKSRRPRFGGSGSPSKRTRGGAMSRLKKKKEEKEQLSNDISPKNEVEKLAPPANKKPVAKKEPVAKKKVPAKKKPREQTTPIKKEDSLKNKTDFASDKEVNIPSEKQMREFQKKKEEDLKKGGAYQRGPQ